MPALPKPSADEDARPAHQRGEQQREQGQQEHAQPIRTDAQPGYQRVERDGKGALECKRR